MLKCGEECPSFVGFPDRESWKWRLFRDFALASSTAFGVSCDCDGCDVSYSDQIESGGGEGKHPTHALSASMSGFAKVSHGFHPATDFFDSLALSLADRVAVMSGCARVDCASAARTQPLRNMRCDQEFTERGNEGAPVVSLVGAQRYLPPPAAASPS